MQSTCSAVWRTVQLLKSPPRSSQDISKHQHTFNSHLHWEVHHSVDIRLFALGYLPPTPQARFGVFWLALQPDEEPTTVLRTSSRPHNITASETHGAIARRDRVDGLWDLHGHFGTDCPLAGGLLCRKRIAK